MPLWGTNFWEKLIPLRIHRALKRKTGLFSPVFAKGKDVASRREAKRGEEKTLTAGRLCFTCRR